VYDQIRSGLEDSIAHSRGKLSLATTRLPSPPPRLAPDQIARLRKRYGMSQSIFAAVLNVSRKTVQSWEQGIRVPSDSALRMLQVVGREPTVVRMILSPERRPQTRGVGGLRRVGRPERITARGRV